MYAAGVSACASFSSQLQSAEVDSSPRVWEIMGAFCKGYTALLVDNSSIAFNVVYRPLIQHYLAYQYLYLKAYLLLYILHPQLFP